nr:MAG TPA: hypothetical protein [Caudoviricetes sp.]
MNEHNPTHRRDATNSKQHSRSARKSLTAVGMRKDAPRWA